MADKKPAKKDDKKKKDAPSKPGLNGHDYFWRFLGIFFALFLLASAAVSLDSPIVDSVFKDPAGGFPPSGSIATESEVAVKRDTKVHIEAGGPVIGTQKAGAHGTVVAGPKTSDGEKFYFVKYAEAPDGWVSAGDISTYTRLVDFLAFVPRFFFMLQEVLIFLAFILGVGCLIVFYQDSQLDFPVKTKSNKKEGKSSAADIRAEMVAAAPVVNEHWLSVKAMLESQNANDWRQAVIEADIMLDEMLEQMGYHGPTVADKMKMIEPADFKTIDDAWEAHKVRNRIAHQGKDYIFTQVDARNTINLFEKVFKEFYYI